MTKEREYFELLGITVFRKGPFKENKNLKKAFKDSNWIETFEVMDVLQSFRMLDGVYEDENGFNFFVFDDFIIIDDFDNNGKKPELLRRAKAKNIEIFNEG